MHKNTRKVFAKLRKMEAEIAYATPTRAAKLTSKIVRLKNSVFDSAGD